MSKKYLFHIRGATRPIIITDKTEHRSITELEDELSAALKGNKHVILRSTTGSDSLIFRPQDISAILIQDCGKASLESISKIIGDVDEALGSIESDSPASIEGSLQHSLEKTEKNEELEIETPEPEPEKKKRGRPKKIKSKEPLELSPEIKEDEIQNEIQNSINIEVE